MVDDDAIEIPITDTLDLHPFRPNEIRDVAHEYLLEAKARGFRQVRLVHGRGIGMQRENIRKLLAPPISSKPSTTPTGVAAGGARRWWC
jgi:dsDNA-specific endonuclease/ATPase MutS2